MRPFSYEQAKTAEGAIETVTGNPDSAYLGGGTTLVDLMKLYVMTPAQVVDVTALPLERIEELADGTLRVGALVRNSDLAHDKRVAERYPVLSQAILAGASGQIRNMATTGGNLMQRTRCYYFRDTAMACNKREPGSGCSAIGGFNRIHAILGGSAKCIATHPSDMCVALAALGATVRVRGPKGLRQIPIVDFHVVPGDHPERETVVEHGELITSVDLPPLPYGHRSAYVKVRDRASFAFALASAAAIVDTHSGTIRQARLALGGVGTKPWRCTEAEAYLVGKPATAETYRRAAEVALQGAQPQADNGFKVELAKRVIVRAFTRAGDAA